MVKKGEDPFESLVSDDCAEPAVKCCGRSRAVGEDDKAECPGCETTYRLLIVE